MSLQIYEKVKMHICIFKSTPIFLKYTCIIKIQGCIFKIHPCIFRKYTSVLFRIHPSIFNEFENTNLHFKINLCILGKIHTPVFSKNYSNCSKYTPVFFEMCTFYRNIHYTPDFIIIRNQCIIICTIHYVYTFCYIIYL